MRSKSYTPDTLDVLKSMTNAVPDTSFNFGANQENITKAEEDNNPW
jgi:hypothetical protein